MKSRGNITVAGACLAFLTLLVVCDTASAFRLFFWRRPVRQGPPAHAPAHGYRRRHVCGHEVVFDAGIGVYVVVGMTDVYYHEGRFYRFHSGVWEISLRADTWKPAGIDKLPPGLQIKAKSMVKVNGNGNSLVKLNGNGNSLVKLNGNDSGSNRNPGGNPGANANGSDKPGAGNNKLSANSGGNDNEVVAPSANKSNNKPDGNSAAKRDTDRNTGKFSGKAAGSGRAKPVSKGKKK